MRLPLLDKNDYSSVDVERVKKMVDQFMENGFTYFDTAAPYHQGNSEVAFREAVVKRYPRMAYTPISASFLSWSSFSPFMHKRPHSSRSDASRPYCFWKLLQIFLYFLISVCTPTGTRTAPQQFSMYRCIPCRIQKAA